jgi:hypothetical protein
MTTKKVGVYFGSGVMSIVEVRGKKILSEVNISVDDAAAMEKVQPASAGEPSETANAMRSPWGAMVAEVLREQGVRGKKAFLGLSDQDLFIRSFQMPILSKNEIDLAVQFEVKKYIPFKTEDMVFDYQRRIDKKSRKMDILFMGVTKTVLGDYLLSLSEAGLQTQAIEPGGFALLRILSLTKQLDPNSSFALIAAQDREAECIIVDRGFFCFSRNVMLLQPSASAGEGPSYKERLINEVRISLDYFRRQFSSRQIAKALFISKNLAEEAEFILGISEDLSLTVERVELEKDKGADSLKDLNSLRAYAIALKDAVKIPLAVNLGKYAQPVIGSAQAEAALPEAREEKGPLVFDIFLIRYAVVLVALLIGLAFVYPRLKARPLTKQLINARAKTEEAVPAGLKDLAPDALEQKKTEYAEKVAALEKIVNSRFSITPFLNSVPAVLERGVWLEEMTIRLGEKNNSLRIRGAVYLEDQGAAYETVSAFYRKLKEGPDVMRGFKDLELRSVTRGEVRKDNIAYQVTYFEISAGG